MRTLILIPARAGSKGLPGKNIKHLGGIPLITHTLLFAQQICGPNDIICLSSNDDKVLAIAEELGVTAPFKRPENISGDKTGTYEVIIHAIEHYERLNEYFDNVLVLQPTSPFRCHEDYDKIQILYSDECDMVVSVRIVKENPYFNLFEQTEKGYLQKSKKSNFVRRQDCPEVYAYNGAFYLINVDSLKIKSPQAFEKNIMYIMPEDRSIDIDTPSDWQMAEYFLSLKKE